MTRTALPQAAAESLAPPKPSALGRERVRSAWIFLAPMLGVLLLVAGWPLVRTIYFGFTDADLSDFASYEFIGFANYLEYDEGEWYGLLADPDWWNAVRNTLVFAVVSVSLETVLGHDDVAVAEVAVDDHGRGAPGGHVSLEPAHPQ